MKIATLILAAGTSSRMKKPKLILPVQGASLLAIAIEHALQSGSNDVYVVLGANATMLQSEVTKYGVASIFNLNFDEGLSTSIVVGVRKLLDYDAILITLADQPNVDADYLKTMIGDFKEHKDLIIASSYGTTYGVPALFPKKYFDDLLKLKGDKGAKEFLNADGIPVKSVSASINLLDIDTPEDYQNLLKEN